MLKLEIGLLDQTQAWGLLSRSISFSGVLKKNKRKRYLKGLRDFSCLVFSSVAIIGRAFWDWDLQLIASETIIMIKVRCMRPPKKLVTLYVFREGSLNKHIPMNPLHWIFIVQLVYTFKWQQPFVWLLSVFLDWSFACGFWIIDVEIYNLPQHSPLRENEGKK